MIEPKELVLIIMSMVLNMKVSGSRTSNQVMVLKLGQMVLSTLVLTRVVRKKVRGNLNGMMEPHTMDNSLITTLKVLEFMFGLTSEDLMDLGSITKCMVRVSLLGQMEKNIVVIN